MSALIRNTLVWSLAVAALLLAAVVGVVSYAYAWYYEAHLDEEWLPIPEHIEWMTWLGIGLMLLGGLGALLMLALRRRHTSALAAA